MHIGSIRRLWILVAFITLASCSSRYRLDLYMVSEGDRQKVKVEQTQYVLDAVLGDAYDSRKLAPGEGNVAVITAATRGEEFAKSKMSLFRFDEYFRCRVYLQLPVSPQADTSLLEGNSFVQFMGRYDHPVEEKIFLPVSGAYVVDSVTSGALFISIDGLFENQSEIPFQLDGQVRLKTSE